MYSALVSTQFLRAPALQSLAWLAGSGVFELWPSRNWVWDQWYTGAGHIIRISSKSWFISLIPFKKWNLYNVYIHSTQTDIFQVFISFNFDDYNWQLMKTPNSVSQKIRILLKTNTKKGFLEILANWKVWTWKVWACTRTQYLVGGSFCLNYCSNAAWHGVDQSVALLRCYESPGCSDSGLQLFCIVGSGISHLPLHNTP